MIKFHLNLLPANGHVKPYEIPFGYTFQSVIFGWLHEHHPRLLHELHSYERVRPYSINCYIHKNMPKVEFTIVSYEQQLSTALLDIITPQKGKSMTVAQKEYIIEDLNIESVKPTVLFHRAKPVKHFHIQFATPCHFNTIHGDYPVRFPMPDELFGNVLTLWKMMAKNVGKNPIELNQQNFRAWINAHMYASSFKMRSASYFIQREKQVAGGQGFVAYRITPLDEYYCCGRYNKNKNSLSTSEKTEATRDYLTRCRCVEFLARLGEYTNVGGHRTAGMGVIRYFPKAYRDSDELNINININGSISNPMAPNPHK